jgi:fluoroquinolone resistance protein
MPLQPSNKADRHYITGEIFNGANFKATDLLLGDYENCTFQNSDFANADLSGIGFIDCRFSSCNLSTIKLGQTAFRDVVFKDCKMVGLHFEHCNDFLFAAGFQNCVLNFSSFYKLKLKKTIFKDCNLQEVDFTEADLSSSIFDYCDLNKAIFDNTVLEKTDFRTAYHYIIDPQSNKLKKAKFSKDGLDGLLHKFDIIIT